MLGTHTAREIVSMLPRFRIVAVSMERLQVGRARIVPVPVPLNGPPDGLGRMASVCPAAELDPREVIEPCIHGLAHADAVIVCPSPNFGVELTDRLALRQGLRAPNDPSELRQMR